MDISVVIPLYNKAPHIQRALNSIFNQSFPPKEIIVVDDGSTDGSGEIVKSSPDPRIKVFRQENAGISSARNHGVSEASYDFIAFLDADDEWKPEHLQAIAMLIQEYPDCGAYATSYMRIGDAGTKIWRPKPVKNTPTGWKGKLDLNSYLELIMAANTFFPSSICVKKACFYKAGQFDVKVRRAQDLDLWLRILLGDDIAYLHEPLTIYYLNTVNRSVVNFKPELGVFLDKLGRLLGEREFPPKTKKLLYEYYCHNLLIKCSEACQKGYRELGLECLKKSSRTQKFRLRWLKWYCLCSMPEKLSSIYLNR
ncbi:MAG: glycosyltransferase family A protein [Anaerolineaceae bacterium]|nr:glycosyltransferase family A protein [Anaerolineaceae bacterium]